VSSSDWPKQSESLTCGSRSTVSVDRSMVNIDWAVTGLGWAWARPGLGRTGPGQARHVVKSGAATSPPGFRIELWSIGPIYGEQTVAVHRACTWFTMDSVYSLPSSHGVRCTGCTAQPPLLPSSFSHGNVFTGGETAILQPRRLLPLSSRRSCLRGYSEASSANPHRAW
jgi:hypothetical protein